MASMGMKLGATPATVPDILIADDDRDLQSVLKLHLTDWGYQVRCACNKHELLEQFYQQQPAVLLLDLQFGVDDGIELLDRLIREGASRPIVLLTAHGSIPTAVKAIQLGAFDFLSKPPDLNMLRKVVEHAIESGTSRDSVESDPPMLVAGESRAMRQVMQMVDEVAPTDAKVLITGESGTGKELVARAIHERSARSARNFVAVNMAALPDKLAESLLFGHERGAFTGADRTHLGWCETADKGTLFLDEIGEMDIALQAKLLRFLQQGAFHRVGSSLSRSVNVRLISATNRDTRKLVKDGLLREDLFYRLQVVEIEIPPLRSRREEIGPLVDYFLARSAHRHQKLRKGVSPEAMHLLEQYAWPGNVRELEHVVERLTILSRGDEITLADLPQHIGGQLSRTSLPSSPASQAGQDVNLRQMDVVERAAILDALEKSDGHAVTAALMLGIGQATLYRKIKRYDIALPRQRTRTKASRVARNER